MLEGQLSLSNQSWKRMKCEGGITHGKKRKEIPHKGMTQIRF